MVPAPDVLDRLDRETRDATELLAASPVVPRLDREEAVRDALAVVHVALDDALRRAPDPRLAGLVARAPVRPAPAGTDPPVLSVAGLIGELLAQQVRLHAAIDPIALCGDVYALARFAAIVPAPGRPTARALAGVHLSAAEVARVVQAAREVLAGLTALLRAVHAGAAESQDDLLRALNGEAGTHPITHDPRELQAVLRAGERSWRRFPYYAARYGERGLRFTRSDSAWLAALAGHGPEVVECQILWLGRVLASRGMPRWLLELHLDVLHDELVAAAPGRRAVHVELQRAAQAMRGLRCQCLAEDRFAALGEAFDRRVDAPSRARLPETGALLVAAVIDEQLGVVRAVSSLAGWLTDPARFTSPWINAVHATLDAARQELARARPSESAAPAGRRGHTSL